MPSSGRKGSQNRSAILNFKTATQLREILLTGRFTVGWYRITRWLQTPPNPQDAPRRGLGQREWTMDLRVLDLVRTGGLSIPDLPPVSCFGNALFTSFPY